MKVSASIELIWQMAGREAVAAEFKEIEPEHFLMALLKYSETPVAEVEKLGAGAEAVKALRADIEALTLELSERNVDAGVLRRELRTVLGKGSTPYKGGSLHRAPATRELFDKAARAAADAGSDTLMGCHVLTTLLESPTPALAQVLAMTRGVKAEGESPSPRSLLSEHGKDVNRLVRKQRLASGDERMAEAKAVLGVLEQRVRNSVFLATDDGETARQVVFALARLLSSKEVPLPLKGKRIIDLSNLSKGESSPDGGNDLLEKVLVEASGTQGFVLYLPAVFTGEQAPASWAETLGPLASDGKLQFLARIPAPARLRVERDAFWRKVARVVSIGARTADEIPFEL